MDRAGFQAAATEWRVTMKAIHVDRAVCANPEAACKLEWLETNGLGGFASSTILGLNTRRYHALLTAATKPPVGRLVLLAKLEEDPHRGWTTLRAVSQSVSRRGPSARPALLAALPTRSVSGVHLCRGSAGA